MDLARDDGDKVGAEITARGIKIRLDTIYLSVLLISLPGYPLVAAGVGVAGGEGALSSVLSMSVRVLNVGLALILIFASLRNRRLPSSDNLIRMLMLFWIAYIGRIFFDTIYAPEKLSQVPSYYWTWAIGGSLIPMLGLALTARRVDEANNYFQWFYIATLAAGIFALFSASGARVSEMGQLAETGRARVGADRLNPIALGHLGAMLAIQSIWAIVFFRRWQRPLTWALLAGGAGIGFYLLVIANSRGPVVAAFACLLTVALSVKFRYKIAVILFLGIIAISIVPLARYVQETSRISAFSRLFGKSIFEQAEQSSRLDLFGAAVDGFMDHPWIGSSLEIPTIGSYPHNVVVESFMALGIFFGFLLVISFSLLSLRGFLSFSTYPQYSWPSLLFFQYLIGAQFSGSLYGSTYLWCAVGLMISFSVPSYSKRLSLNDSRTAHLLPSRSRWK